MTAEPDQRQAVPTVHCRVCETAVPAAAFCGLCGAHLSAERGDGRGWLRLRAFGAAPGEHALRLSVASSLFPHLPHCSRTPFRLALAMLPITLVGCALLRWQAPLIAVTALGIPLLFVIYLYEADAHDDLPVSTLLLTGLLGVGLGIGWALSTGEIIAGAYDVALSDGVSAGSELLEGLAIPLGGAVLMLAPAVLVRLLRPPTRESLDGFVIGSLGAICFTAALTLTLLAPQFATGMVARGRPVSGLLVEAGIRGVAMPLTAAAIGGMFGAALWFARPASASHRHRSLAVGLALGVVVALFINAGLGLIDVVPLPQGLHLGLHLLAAAVALLAARIAVQAALLHEEHDPVSAGEPLLCPHCEHVVPDMSFCPNCGVATRASSRSSRTARRLARPDAQPPTAAATVRPGYALPAGSYAAPPVRHTSHRRLFLMLGGAVVVAVAAVVAVVVDVTPAVPRYVCPPDCGRPPIGQPVETNPRFTAGDGAFSVAYPGEGTAYKATLKPNGVVLDFVRGDTGTLELFGERARDRTPQQIAGDLIGANYPNATTDYQIPNAMVGYQPGYGVVADDYPQDATGSYARLRVLVMVAVKNGLALIAAAAGPYHEFSPDFGSGHPSGANLQLALDMAKYVNSFTWRGDPSR